MTSKEALKELKENAQENCEWKLDRLNTIEKDLEILEILKKYVVRIFDYPEGGDYFCLELHKFICEKEGMKFKEWLEKWDTLERKKPIMVA